MIWFDVDVGLKGTLLANPVCGAVTAGSEATPPPETGEDQGPDRSAHPVRFGSLGIPVDVWATSGDQQRPRIRHRTAPRIGSSAGDRWIPGDVQGSVRARLDP